MATIFVCDNVTKAYGGLLAVKDLSFFVETGEIYAIVGPNGAGKTTLFDTISGVSPVTNGAVRFDGHEIQRQRPDSICRLGIARTFQTTVGFDTQTVLTNALVGAILGREGTGNPTMRFSDEALEAALVEYARWRPGDQKTDVGMGSQDAGQRLCDRQRAFWRRDTAQHHHDFCIGRDAQLGAYRIARQVPVEVGELVPSRPSQT